MRYWVFTERRLEAALRAYAARIAEPGVDPKVVVDLIRECLDSPEARVAKLQGGASYQGDMSR